MVGDDEARARAVLAEMQLRISQGPTSALGIGEIVTPEEVRAAFLGLTKQFHPARFGRLAPDLQRLANEVFLGIKAAHDHMLKVLGTSSASMRSGSRTTSGIPTVHTAEGTSRTSAPGVNASSPRGTQSIPRLDGTPPPTGLARGTDRSSRSSSPVVGGNDTGNASYGTGRASTPPTGIPVGAPHRPSQQFPAQSRTETPTGSIPAQSRTRTASSSPVTRPTGSIPIQRPPTPVPSATQPSSGRFPAVPPGTVPGVLPASSRSTTPSGSSQPLARPPGPQTQSTQPLPRGPTPSSGIAPLPRPFTPVPPGTQPGVAGPRPTTPPINTARSATPSNAPPTYPPRAGSAITPPTQPPRGYAADSFNPPTVRDVAPPPGQVTQPIPRLQPQGDAGFDEASAFRECATLMEQKQWTAARLALHALAAKVPQSKPYRAWLCYARGREAYIAGRVDEAILEMQRALQLEPDLAHAKHALTELQRRR